MQWFSLYICLMKKSSGAGFGCYSFVQNSTQIYLIRFNIQE